MKVKIYKYNLSVNIEDDIQKVKDYFVSPFVKKYIRNGIPLEITSENTTIPKDQSIPLFKDNKYDLVVYMTGQLNSEYFGWTFVLDKNIGIYLKCDEVHDKVDYTWKSLAHEIMHFLRMKKELELKRPLPDPMDLFYRNGKEMRYYKNDNPYAEDGNFAEAFKVLSVFYNDYKYFSKAEVEKWKLKPELWTLLDKMREECGFPFNINSGLRTKEENDKLKDSASDSAHLSGLAVDISIKDSIKRYKLVQVALNNGINRLGIADTFIHIDISPTHPKNVIWLYN